MAVPGEQYRNPANLWIAIALVVFTFGWALLARSIGGAIGAAVFAAFLWVIAIRPRLWMSDEGITVRNVRTQSIPWHRITSLGMERVGRMGGRSLTFHLVDGRVVRAYAVGWGPGGLYGTAGLGRTLGLGYSRATVMRALNYWGGRDLHEGG